MASSRLSRALTSPNATTLELSTVFVHKAVDNDRRRTAKRLIGMEFLTEGIRPGHPQADGLQAPPIYPQILCSSLWKSL